MCGNTVVVLLLSALLVRAASSQRSVSSLGCYKDSLEQRDLPFQSDSPHAGVSVENCISECRKYYYRYAGLQDGRLCFCGSRYGSLGEAEELQCNKPCQSSSGTPSAHDCGGTLTNSVFDTGQKVSGPPSSLEISNISETGMRATWNPPKAPNGNILFYTVTAELVDTFSSVQLPPSMTWTYNNATRHADVLDLHPGSQYNISVRSDSDKGQGVPLSVLTSTLVGEPNQPQEPSIVEQDLKHGQMKIKIENGTSDNGPVTAYRIIVVNGIADFSPELLDSYVNAQKNGLSFYIAAEIQAKDMKDYFIVGDKRQYGGYYNAPLPRDQDVHITLAVISSFNNHTRVSFSSQNSDIIVSVMGETAEGGLEEGLTVAIVVCSVLLCITILAYFVARRFAPQRRGRGATRMEDPQELCLQGPMIEVENYGYIPEEEELNKPDHYTQLKKLLWDIPRNFLDVSSNEILGNGAFGTVNKGTVLQNGFSNPAAVHCIEDGELSVAVKRNMLQELAVLIRCGTGNHSNVVRLIGTCESPEMLYVVLEHHPATLKDILVESRTLERPAHERNLSVVCSLPPQALMQVALGVSQGMEHLSSNKIIHKQLAACSVLMADGMVPKIANFGIAKYNRPNVVADFTRWTAREIFKSRHFTVKSDVWSFGCLLWEMAALGGTLYSNVPTLDVGTRVERGLRPPQMNHISDDLYQLMLQCWQLDLDERPTFSEITASLCDLLENSEAHLDLTVIPGFRYEPYLRSLEQSS